MAKTSKTIPQKEKASSSSSRQDGDKASALHEFVPSPCVTKNDFKVENPPSIPSRCIGDVSKMRSAPFGEKTESPIPKSGKDNKRKKVSKTEDSQDKKAPARKRRKSLIPVDIESFHQLDEEEEDEGEDSVLVDRARKPLEAAKPSEPETLPRDDEVSNKDASKAPESPEVEIVPRPSTSTPERAGSEIPRAEQSAPSDLLGAMTIGHSPSMPTYYKEAIREAQALQMPDLGGVPSEEDPFRDCFTRVDTAADLNDASTLFEETQRLLS
ncbi:protein pxr1-like [Nicotiana sylvestris]|uniref:protein pxr1-like n=1 Tax=Nicotiana sylvestris TaxID=4096 RepID=UPI00388CD38D